MNDCCENCYYSFVNAELKKNSDNHCVICGLLMLKGKVAVRRKDFKCGDWRIKMQTLEAADARPVKRGHWITNPYMLNRQKCSECGFWSDDLQADDYCPSCGADMRGEPNE